LDWNQDLGGLLAALGLGLLIGVVRERRHDPGSTRAGVRTHALVALLGVITIGLGDAAFVATLAVVGALAVVAYWLSAPDDPGLTGEVGVVVTFVLGGLAGRQPPLAAALGVLAAVLMHAKQPLQRFSRELISERELQDALMLAAAALVVMPLLPDRPVDPFGVLHPATLWRIVVLVMAVGMLGHVALRAVGPGRGLPVAGFFSGFASSTAAVASFGLRAKAQPEVTAAAAAAALLANLASLLLLCAVVGAASPALLSSVAWPMAASATALLLVASLGLRRHGNDDVPPGEASPRAFRISHALFIAALVAVVLLMSAWLRQHFGEAGVLVAAMLVALAELQSAAASIAQLHASDGLLPPTAGWGLVGVIGAGAVSKLALAFASGSRRYAAWVSTGLIAMTVAPAATMVAVTR